MSDSVTAFAGAPVTAISAFTVPVTESERILARWMDDAAIMARQPGFIRAWVYDTALDHGELRLVNVAHWDSREALDTAKATPEVRAAILRMLNDPELRIAGPLAVYQGLLHGRGPWRFRRDLVGVEAS